MTNIVDPVDEEAETLLRTTRVSSTRAWAVMALHLPSGDRLRDVYIRCLEIQEFRDRLAEEA